MVKLICCGAPEFRDRISNKKIVCFGAGRIFDDFLDKYSEYRFESRILFAIDNNESLSGKYKTFNGVSIPIISFQKFIDLQLNKEAYAILITNIAYLGEILDQLDHEAALDGVECFISFLLEMICAPVKFGFTRSAYTKIPKKINYCWFGGKPIPAHLQQFMKSWEKFCQDYEIVRWDESNYDVTKNLYMKQAYETGKWGFVPDYARLDIIYNHGGIYLDTDVEIIRSFDDLLYDDMFCGFESNNYIALGLGFGAVKGHDLIKKMLAEYDNMRFVHDDGSLNLTPSPGYQTENLRRYGFKINNTYQNLGGIAVYPSEVLSPKHYYSVFDNFTENTFSIHHYDASWAGTAAKNKINTISRQLKEILCSRG